MKGFGGNGHGLAELFAKKTNNILGRLAKRPRDELSTVSFQVWRDCIPLPSLPSPYLPASMNHDKTGRTATQKAAGPNLRCDELAVENSYIQGVEDRTSIEKIEAIRRLNRSLLITNITNVDGPLGPPVVIVSERDFQGRSHESEENSTKSRYLFGMYPCNCIPRMSLLRKTISTNPRILAAKTSPQHPPSHGRPPQQSSKLCYILRQYNSLFLGHSSFARNRFLQLPGDDETRDSPSWNCSFCYRSKMIQVYNVLVQHRTPAFNFTALAGVYGRHDSHSRVSETGPLQEDWKPVSSRRSLQAF